MDQIKINCPLCLSEYTTEEGVKLSCGCINYSSCLSNWTLSQIQVLSYQTSQTIPCMHCKSSFKVDEVFFQIDSVQRESINSELLQGYLRKTTDVCRCPNKDCSYGGIIDLSNYCQDPLLSESCGFEWREKSYLSARYKYINFFTKNNRERKEMLSRLWEEALTQRCLDCDIYIQKSGGCDHMTCQRCKCEFCWLCTARFSGHTMRFCGISCMTKIAI